MTDSYYITTPIYYVNDSPHIGHAYTTIACDVMARFQRLDGKDVKFLTGTDEHGQKVDKSAKAKGVDPQSFTDEVSERFRALVNASRGGEEENLLNISNTDFIRTTEERHKKAAQALWERIEANGYIYKDNYGGWYAVRDEAYYQEDELTEKDGKKVAPSGAEVEWVEEESYFFKLSSFGDKLLELYDNHPDFVMPKNRLNEVRSFVSGGLNDLSISRTTFDWGVPVPGDDAHVMYVWIDALTNYLTSCGFPDMDGEMTTQWQNATHVVGKDILRFHAVYWPAFLMAADLPLPKHIVAHGWWTIEGEKMSKSIGNVLAPKDMIEAAGSVDALRYFMLRAMPFGNDGDFSSDRMRETVNADLANNIGNLAQRSLSMIAKNCEGKVPECLNVELEAVSDEAVSKYKAAMEGVAYDDATKALVGLASQANEYFSDNAPWALKKSGTDDDLKRMGEVLYVVAETLRIIGVLLQPFCTVAANKLLDQLAVAEDERAFKHLTAEYALKSGTELPKPEGVFPRLD